MKQSFLSIIRKEFIHILRDWQSLLMILTMPLLMLLLYGYAINLDMKAIDLVIADQSGGSRSRDLIRHIGSTDFFRLIAEERHIDDIGSVFQSRKAQGVLIIPPDYDSRLSAGREVRLQLVIDASDPNAANFISHYVSGVVMTSGPPSRRLFNVEPRIFYNPEMRSAPFLVPGLIALILLLICALLTSIAIVREKETGTMEQLLVSPAKPWQIIIGKVLPYTFLGFINGLMILLAGSFLFDVPIEGSLVLVMATMLVYVLTGLSLGMLVSTIAETQAVAMLAAMSITILPSLLMSGFIFPVKSMPAGFQVISRVIPATYFIEIIRGIVLKGNTLENLYRPSAVLLGLDGILILLSIRSFKIRLE